MCTTASVTPTPEAMSASETAGVYERLIRLAGTPEEIEEKIDSTTRFGLRLAQTF